MKKHFRKPFVFLMVLVLALSVTTPVMAKTTRQPYIQKTVNLKFGRSDHVPFYWANSKKATYTSSNPSVAVLEPNSSGVYVHAVNPGTAIMTTTYKGKTYKTRITVTRVPFEEETFWADYGSERGPLPEGMEFTFENSLKYAKLTHYLEWESVPGADGYEIRKISPSGKIQEASCAIDDLPNDSGFQLCMTTRGTPYYRFEGELANHEVDGTTIYGGGIRAYKIVNGEKIYTDWHKLGIDYGFGLENE